jgi:probable rRNA maturation factor
MQRFGPRLDPNALWSELSLHIVDDETMQAAHQDYFGKDTVTDVISQQYLPMPGENGMTGELVINLQQALRARKARNWSPQKELALYLAHGIDHLHGSTDDTEKERCKMRKRELRWLRLTEAEGFIYHNLFSTSV